MLKIVGDICFSDGDFDQGFGLGQYVKDGGNPFRHIQLDSSDFWFGNLECVISDTTEVVDRSLNNFRIESQYIGNIPHMNLYTVANNHSMQHGADAFNNTQINIEKISRTIGGLKNKHIIVNHDETSYGIISFSLRQEVFFNPPQYWCSPEYSDIVNEFKSIKDTDFKIVYIHWGNEFINYPNIEQKKLAHWLVDIGFDLVIGTHPHVLQGYELYKEKYIFYSIGNFVFNMPAPNTQYAVVINVSRQASFEISYDYVNIKNGIPQLINEDKVPSRFNFKELNSLISLKQDNELYYAKMFKELAKYQKINRTWILKNLYKRKFTDIVNIFLSFIKRRIIKNDIQ